MNLGARRRAVLQQQQARKDALVSAELDREIASYVARDTAMQQRATVLIGAASIVGALQASEATGWATIVSLALALCAAVAGVVVVFPRTGQALDVRSMRDGLTALTLTAGQRKLVNVKLEVLEADERWLTRRGRYARAGFISLSVGIAIATIASFVPASEAPVSPEPHPTQISS